MNPTLNFGKSSDFNIFYDTEDKRKNRSLWTRAHLVFRLQTHNLVLVAKGTQSLNEK